MTPSVLEGLDEMLGLLDPTPDGVDAVYDHEPEAETTGPVYVTVALDGITPTEQRWAVRIYSQAADGMKDATLRLYAAIDAVDDAIKVRGLAPSEWAVGFMDELQAHVARSFVELGRESF